MQWNAGANAGFAPANATPWLPLAADYEKVNVSAQGEDPASMLSLYRRLIALRRAEPALSVGGYTALPTDGDLIAYIRHDVDRPDGGRRFLVVLNLGAQEQRFELPGRGGTIAVATHNDREGQMVSDEVAVRANEAMVIAMTP
jgi:alpha-glucosidase